MYMILRDAPEIMNMMSVHTAWGQALETHIFWEEARRYLDPIGLLNHLAVIRPPQQLTTSSSAPAVHRILSPYRHYHRILSVSCHVCRVNSPNSNCGIGTAKRQSFNPILRTVVTCKDHRHGTFCGLCLQAPLYPNPDADLHVGVHENEDEETWPSVETTCRSCREDALLKRVWTHPELREAVGGRTFDAEDWETRYVIDAFLDTADGTIEEVVRTARDKHWLRRHTRLAELLRLAILSWQLSYRNGDDRRIEPEDEEDDLDTDWDDPELLSMTEEREGVRDLAMSDWARSRIMDGHWLNPADSFYRYTNNGRPTHVQAVHPFPFTGESMVEQLDQHPAESLVVVPPPPTLELCETAYRAHVKQMRSILAPALSNVMRKLVIECAEDGADAVVRAARMEIEDVVAELREAGVWYKGMDWLEHRRSTRDEADRQERRDRRVIDEDADSDSSSNKSNTTSPVLSTTTVATTPSPPPSSRGTTKESDDEIESTRVPIPVSPVLNPPTLLAHIPFVPVTTTHLPHHSMEILKTLWREACAPLYHCRCTICERARRIATGNAPTETTPIENYHNQRQSAAPEPEPQNQDEIREQQDGDSELELEYFDEVSDQILPTDDSDAVSDDLVSSDEDPISSLPDTQGVGIVNPKSPYTPIPLARRKRSCDELEEDGEEERKAKASAWHAQQTILQAQAQETPPKRARLDFEGVGSPQREYQQQQHKIIQLTPGPSPSRQRKRGSEELESVMPEKRQAGNGNGMKKARVESEGEGEGALDDGDEVFGSKMVVKTGSEKEQLRADEYADDR